MKPSAWPDYISHSFPLALIVLLSLLTSRIVLPHSDHAIAVLPALAGVYYWALFFPATMPLLAVMVLGLLQDVLIGLPMGLSSLVLLLIWTAARLAARKMMIAQFIVVWVVFAALLIPLAVLMGGVLSWLQQTSFADGAMLALKNVGYTWLCYPLFHVLFNRLYHMLGASSRNHLA